MRSPTSGFSEFMRVTQAAGLRFGRDCAHHGRVPERDAHSSWVCCASAGHLVIFQSLAVMDGAADDIVPLPTCFPKLFQFILPPEKSESSGYFPSLT